MTSIEYRTFSGCSSLTSVTIPNSVTSIGESAFNGCENLTSIELPATVTSIGKWGFQYCKALTNVEIPNSVTFIGEAAFEHSGIVNVSFPEGITEINAWMFNDCGKLETVTIPASVTSIGNNAFKDCPSLTSVTIPNSVTSIGSQAFYGCSGLTSIYVLNETPASISSSSFSNYNATLHVPKGSLAAYQAADYWKYFWRIKEFDPTGIEDIDADADAVTFEITSGGIQLTAAEGKMVAVYSTNGALVEKIDSYDGEEITLDKGAYILCVGGKSVKVKL